MSNKSKYIRTAGAAALGMLVLVDTPNASAMMITHNCSNSYTSQSGITYSTFNWSSAPTVFGENMTSPSSPILAITSFIDDAKDTVFSFSFVNDALAQTVVSGGTVSLTWNSAKPPSLVASLPNPMPNPPYVKNSGQKLTTPRIVLKVKMSRNGKVLGGSGWMTFTLTDVAGKKQSVKINITVDKEAWNNCVIPVGVNGVGTQIANQIIAYIDNTD